MRSAGRGLAQDKGGPSKGGFLNNMLFHVRIYIYIYIYIYMRDEMNGMRT